MMESYRILHIEDNEGDARLVQIYAADNPQLDLTVDHVNSLAAAESFLNSQDYDLLLLDLNLPESRGLETLIQVMDTGLSLPVIVLTALDDRDLGVKAVKIGAQDFLLKGPTLEHTLARAVRYAIERYRQFSLQRELSIRDELTGLYNRRGLKALAEQQFRLAQRRNEQLTFFIADIDEMKAINDRFGHQTGDEALRDMARVMQLTFRSSDVLARVGGDEFAVIAVDTRQNSDGLILERWRQTMSDYFETTPRVYTLSMSVGRAVFQPDDEVELDDLLARADQAMYADKQGEGLKIKGDITT